MKRLTLLFMLLAAVCMAQTSKRYPALLWKISGKGLSKPSYLYGTMHVSNRVAYYLSEQFFDALRSVDVVGLETNPGEWLENMEQTGELAEITEVRDQNVNRNFYKTAFAVTFPEKRVFQSILSYDPDIINGLLYRQNKTRENFEESTYIDLFIYQSASKLNKPVISLEDFATSEIKARLSALPDEDAGEQSYSGYGNGQKIEDAYREGNLDMIDSLSRLASGNNMQRYLIDDRNVFFVNTIDSVMRTRAIFSGVGAAHLPGDNGVIELLRKKGYTVEPIEPRVSKKSNQQREDLDQQVRPVTFSRQYAADSLFSVDLPGKLYTIMDAGQLKYTIHADMVNGSFYTIVRLKHFGPLFNVTADQVRLRVDSLLFEHIPGKIIRREEITAGDQIRGLEVANRTRRGDEQRYRIYFTADEMIMFKLGGKHGYAGGDEAARFFNSISFGKGKTGNVTFTPPTGGFTVSLPGSYSYQKLTQTGVAGSVEDLFAADNGQVSGVKHAVYNDFDYLEEDTFELNELARNVLEIFRFTHDMNFELRREQELPVIRFRGKHSSGKWFSGKLFIKSVHYYLVYQTSPEPLKMDEGIFSSFRIGDFRYLHPIREVTDQEFSFTAKDEVTDDARSRFNEAYARAYAQTVKKKDSLRADYAYRSGNKYYYSPSSCEYVSISFEKYNDYDYRDPAKLATQIENNFRTNTTMFVARRRMTEKSGLRDMRWTLGDTATTRALEVRVLVYRNTMHELTAPYDTVVGMSGWKKDFFESFTPFDSVSSVSIFENKFHRLLEDLASNDTVKRQAGNRTLQNGLSMQEAFAPEFIRLLSSPKLAQISEDSRAQLFVNAGTMRNDGIIAPYRKLYLQYTDSFYLQLCLLKGLAYLRSPAAFKAFQELILKEPPLLGDENSVGDVFNVLRDSLPLCKVFYPDMLTLTRYEEFRNPVYALLADLVDQKLVTPAKYGKQKDVIITDAALALKRYSPAAARTENDESGLGHLDRASREIAENIRKSLDGLANNIIYSGDYRREAPKVNRPPLVNYAYLLAPLYSKDEKAREFFTRLDRVRSQDIALPVAVSLLKYNVVHNDSALVSYSRDPYTRAYFFSELEKNGLTQKFDKRYLDQQKLVQSVIMSQRQLNAYYGYEKDKARRDSMALLKVLDAENKYQKGKLYVYRVGKTRTDEQWSAVFVHEHKTVTSRMEVLSASFYIDPAKNEQQNLNDLLSFFRLSYRKRALVNTGS